MADEFIARVQGFGLTEIEAVPSSQKGGDSGRQKKRDQEGASLIAIHGLEKSFGTVQALSGVELELDGGQIIGLLGENGCGKTTLLKVL